MDLTFAFLKPEALEDPATLAAILAMIEESGLTIVKQERVVALEPWVMAHYEEHSGKPFFPDLIEQIAGKEILILELRGENVCQRWRALMGPYDETERNKPEHAHTIRARFMKPGSPVRYNFCHGTDKPENVTRERVCATYGLNPEILPNF